MSTPPEQDAPPADALRGIVDLFAGIGCVADGFERAGGFETIALVDIDLDARDTHHHNRPNLDYLVRDVATLDAKELLDAADGRTISGVVGCPPCQGFSAAGLRDTADERNQLLGAFFRVIGDVKPTFFVMENVPGVLYRHELTDALATWAPQYKVTTGVINAACYGLPQSRQRAIVIGLRDDLDTVPELPVPTHLGTRPTFHYTLGKLVDPSGPHRDGVLGESPHIGVKDSERRWIGELLDEHSSSLEPLVTVGDALRDLPALVPVRGRAGATAYARSLIGDPEADLLNHELREHSADLIRRLGAVDEGGRPKTDRKYYSQAYTRLHRRGLARTITTNFHNAGCGRFTHYAEPRTLTVREAARLQGIQDDFAFHGHRHLQQRFVGNAFPTPLATAIARQVSRQLTAAGA